MYLHFKCPKIANGNIYRKLLNSKRHDRVYKFIIATCVLEPHVLCLFKSIITSAFHVWRWVMEMVINLNVCWSRCSSNIHILIYDDWLCSIHIFFARIYIIRNKFVNGYVLMYIKIGNKYYLIYYIYQW